MSGFKFECRACGRAGEVPDDAVSEHDAERVTVKLPPGWFSLGDDGLECLTCVDADVLRRWVAEQMEIHELEQIWDAPEG